MRSLQPPEAAISMMRRVGVDASIIGDLIEEHSNGRSTWWFWTQAFGAIITKAPGRLRRATSRLIHGVWLMLIPGAMLWRYLSGEPLRSVLTRGMPWLFLVMVSTIVRVPRPYSPSRVAIKLAIILIVMHVWYLYLGEPRVALGLDLFFVFLGLCAFIATRIWPDKIWFRRPGERRYSEVPHSKPE